MVKKTFSDPQIEFSVNVTPSKWVMGTFFMTCDKGAPVWECGGKEKWMSDPEGSYFEDCEASSVKDESHGCRDGLEGDWDVGRQWLTDSEGIGATMVILFKERVHLTRLEWQQVPSPNEMVRTLEVR